MLIRPCCMRGPVVGMSLLYLFVLFREWWEIQETPAYSGSTQETRADIWVWLLLWPHLLKTHFMWYDGIKEIQKRGHDFNVALLTTQPPLRLVCEHLELLLAEIQYRNHLSDVTCISWDDWAVSKQQGTEGLRSSERDEQKGLFGSGCLVWSLLYGNMTNPCYPGERLFVFFSPRLQTHVSHWLVLHLPRSCRQKILKIFDAVLEMGSILADLIPMEVGRERPVGIWWSEAWRHGGACEACWGLGQRQLQPLVSMQSGREGWNPSQSGDCESKQWLQTCTETQGGA